MNSHAYTKDQLVEQPANAVRSFSLWERVRGEGVRNLIFNYEME